MLNHRRSLRNLVSQEEKEDEEERRGGKKKWRSEGEASGGEDEKRPLRVHAQRKFASVVGNSQSNSSKERCCNSSKNPSWNAASNSKSNPGTPPPPNVKKRPKTEDFLTFLCLRGTNLLPPELDFFSKASSQELDEAEAVEDVEEPHEEIKKRKNNLNSHLVKSSYNASVQALKRKYVAQRIAKQNELRSSPAKGRTEGMKTRSSDTLARRSARVASKPAFKSSKIIRKKPSAATIMAKRKTKIAAKRISRMLSCLAPRGTSNAAFLRTMKKLPEGRSLRKRDVSEVDESSTDDESLRQTRRKTVKRQKSAKLGKSEEDEEEEEEMELRSRKRSKLTPKKETFINKREMRSLSRDSSESSTSTSKPLRKTKKRASLILNKTDSDIDEDGKISKKGESEKIIYSPKHDRHDKKNSSTGKDSSCDDKLHAVDTFSMKKSSCIIGYSNNRDSTLTSVTCQKTKVISTHSSLIQVGSKGLENDSITPPVPMVKEKKSSKEKKKQKSTSNLKELQDRLLQEAKKKISDDERNLSRPSSQIYDGNEISSTLISAPLRRLSKDGSSRNSTPPRKLLPRSELERTSTESPHPHLSVGVVGAALASSSSRVTLMAAGASPLVQQSPIVPLNQPLVINTGGGNMTKTEVTMPHIASQQHQSTNSIPLIMPNNMMVHVRGPSGNVIQTGAIGIQLTGVPQIAVNSQQQLQSQGVMVQKPPSQVLTNPQAAAFMTRPSFNFAHQPLLRTDANLLNQTVVCNSNLVTQSSGISSSANLIMTPRVTSTELLSGLLTSTKQSTLSSQIALNSMNTATENPIRICTDVTTTNTQPLVSPGPPLLSPQEQITNKTPTKKLATPLLLNHSSKNAQTSITEIKATAAQNLPMCQVFVQNQNQNSLNQNSIPTILPGNNASNVPLTITTNSVETSSPSLSTTQSSIQYVGYSAALTPAPQGNISHSYANNVVQTKSIPEKTSLESHSHTNSLLQVSAPAQSQQQPLPPTIETTPHVLLSSNIQPSNQRSDSVDSNNDLDNSKITSDQKIKCLNSSKACNRIFNKNSSKCSTPNTSSFKVENESSPYAFDVNDSKPELNFRNRPLVENKQGKKVQQCGISLKDEKESITESSDSNRIVQLDISKENEDEGSSSDDSSEETGGSIPIPPELASQLAAQAAKESSSNETTYFIPLKNNSGQSFGVAVKLGTEGPAGPNQKVIMKAKLVTQPFDKTSGARIIGGRDDESVTISLKNDDSTRKKKSHSIMPSVRAKSQKHLGNDSESDSISTASDIQERNRVILRDEPASCLGRIESFERFPKLGQHAHLIEAPVYQPSEKEFEDPMKYIEHIRTDAEQFGICKIIPPKSFKPECNVDDDMRFTAYNQYIQKMMHRWGPNTKEMAAIKKYLATQNIVIKPHPVVGGVEIDLPALFHAVQSFGGLTEVIQRKKWGKIADYLRVPKGTQDRGNKLDDIYCKYLLPYDTLSEVEREELLRLVDEEYEEKNKKRIEQARNDYDDEDDDEEENEDEEEDEELHECVVKGKSTSLSQFFRVARNHMMMVFKSTSDPEPREVEEEYWRLVMERDCHIQVQQGSIDAGGLEGFGFPTSKMSSCGRHPWNLKILSNNPRSLLRTMGPVMGVTVPTLHVGMLFTTGCWYRDPHGLPWVEYQHSGASKIWYGIPDSHSIAFYTAMKQLVPTFCKNKKIWLPSDTTMVPPNLLVKYGVSVCRLIQEPGQFVIVFPKAYTSNICSGYCVAESVYFAPRDYLGFAEQEFNDIRDSTEPMMFPIQKLILSIATDEKSSIKTLRLVHKHLEKIRDYEYAKRLQISEMGVKTSERISLRKEKEKQSNQEEDQEEEDEYECESCSANLYVSFIYDIKEDSYYCLDHGIECLQKTKFSLRKNFKLLFTHSKDEITTIIKLVNRKIEDALSEGSSDDGETDSRSPSPQKRSRVIYESSPTVQTPFSDTLSTRKNNSIAKTKSESPKSSSGASSSSVAVNKQKKNNSKKTVKKVSSDEDDDYDSKEEEEEAKPRQKSLGSGKTINKKMNKKVNRDISASSKPTSSPSSVASKSNRKTKRESRQKTGNLASELLDMLLSTSEDESEECDYEEDDSDESWK
uniref:Putative LOC100870657 [Apis florea] n=1 Tax=Lepeophtheirus salmonis TaxID=72036 RepID=A0A0K2T9N0_LEPSM